MQSLPKLRTQIFQPKIMTRSRHQEENNESKKAKHLKWKLTNRQVFCIRQKDTCQRIDISKRMKLDNAEYAMNRCKEKHSDS